MEGCVWHSGTGHYSTPGGARQLLSGLYQSNLLLNPFLHRSEQLPNRISSSANAPGRGRTPWYTMDCSWVWEGVAPEGLPEGTHLPPAPLPQYSSQGPVRLPVAVLTAPNSWAAMLQVVELPRELQRRGVPAAAAATFLDSSPALELSVWYCGNSQGRARCEVWLALDYGVGEVPSWLQATNLSSGRYAAVATTGVKPSLPGKWTLARLRLQGYPPGCRRAFVVFKGEGESALLSQNVGVWGTKFAAPTLRLLPAGEEEA